MGGLLRALEADGGAQGGGDCCGAAAERTGYEDDSLRATLGPAAGTKTKAKNGGKVVHYLYAKET